MGHDTFVGPVVSHSLIFPLVLVPPAQPAIPDCQTMYEYTIPTKAIITYTDHDWRLQDVLAREPGPNELLIQVLATGICHTDIVNVGGIYPRILGHEGAGNILRKGPKCDESLAIGDAVLLSFAHCKRCHTCVTGHPAHCKEQVPITIAAQDPNFALAESEGEDPALGEDEKGRKRVVAASYFGHSSFSGIALVKESSVVAVKDYVQSDEDLKRFAPLGCGSRFFPLRLHKKSVVHNTSLLIVTDALRSPDGCLLCCQHHTAQSGRQRRRVRLGRRWPERSNGEFSTF